MKARPIFAALAATLVTSLSACESERLTDSNSTKPAVADPVLAMLSATGDWEVTANPVSLKEETVDDFMENEEFSQITPAALRAAAEQDRAWYAADGTRYEVLYIHENGRSYGRREGARNARVFPDAINNFGAFQGVLQSSEDPFAEGSIGFESAAEGGDLRSGDEIRPKARITTNWEDDRRYRVSTGMTTYPTRVIGNMTGSGDTQDGGCTGTKIGPRAVLTAAHCVMDSNGNITLNGRFNPGQTRNTTPNGSIRWNGAFLRDWRIHRRYDYAVVYLDDSSATVGLGWMGIVWWNSSSSYNGLGSKLFGYPCGANRGCGQIDEQMCKASPRADKRCDGWMYGHSSSLDSNSFRNDELLQYDNDMSSGQSGSAVWTWFGNDPAVMAVNTHSWNGVSMGPRFRQNMWDDVCSWIAHPAKQSVHADHPLCN